MLLLTIQTPRLPPYILNPPIIGADRPKIDRIRDNLSRIAGEQVELNGLGFRVKRYKA